VQSASEVWANGAAGTGLLRAGPGSGGVAVVRTQCIRLSQSSWATERPCEGRCEKPCPSGPACSGDARRSFHSARGWLGGCMHDLVAVVSLVLRAGRVAGSHAHRVRSTDNWRALPWLIDAPQDGTPPPDAVAGQLKPPICLCSFCCSSSHSPGGPRAALYSVVASVRPCALRARKAVLPV
jgi:hypothetical protein